VKPDTREITVRLKPDTTFVMVRLKPGTTFYEWSSVTVVVSAFPAQGRAGQAGAVSQSPVKIPIHEDR
jgi:hypothetical protein